MDEPKAKRWRIDCARCRVKINSEVPGPPEVWVKVQRSNEGGLHELEERV